MAEMVTFSSNGGRSQGYLAIPESGQGPGVIVIQEWWGLVPHITGVADRLAEAGFVALAPDLFHGVTTGEPDEAMRLMMGLAMDSAAEQISGAAQYLFEHDSTSADGIGVVGFCMGGSLALWSATLARNILVAVGFYPALPWEHMSPNWPSYSGKSAILHCSEEDGTSAAEGIQSAKSSIEGAGGSVEIFDYPGTHHAFFNEDRPEVHDAAAAAVAWDRTIDAFRRRLIG